MTTRSKCQSLARKLGCELEYNRRRHAKQVEIYLPEGMKMAGSIYADLQMLDGGMELLDCNDLRESSDH